MSRHAWAWRVAALFAAVAIVGCTSQADTDQLRNNQLALRGMIANDRQQLGALQEKVERLNSRIDEIEHQPGGGAGASNQQMGALNERVAKLEAEVNALQTLEPSASAAAAGGLPPASAETAALPAPVAAPTPAAAAEVSSPDWRSQLDAELAGAKDSAAPGAELYRQGLAAMKADNYRSAVVKFAQLEHSYPKSELAEPAEYFSANALYESGKYDQSVLQFNDLAMRYPKGRFATGALLREAQAFLKINDRIDARLTLQQLVANYPGTPEAHAAGEMLKTL